MKLPLRTLWGLFTLNNLLSIAFVAYIGNVIHGLWKMSLVPLAGPELPPSSRIRSHFSSQQPFDMHFYLSDTYRLDLDFALYLGNFTDISYSEGMYFRVHAHIFV